MKNFVKRQYRGMGGIGSLSTPMENMFNSIGEILSKFTPQQRIIALLLVLFTITTISLGPSLIESLTPPPPTEYQAIVEEQNKKIQSLSSEVIRLNDEVVSGNQECTNKIINREREIAIYIEDLIRMGKGSMGKNQLVKRTETYNGMDTILMSSPMIIEDNDMERMVTGLQTLKSSLVKK